MSPKRPNVIVNTSQEVLDNVTVDYGAEMASYLKDMSLPALVRLANACLALVGLQMQRQEELLKEQL